MSNATSTTQRVASFFNSVRNKRPVSPAAQRLLELCVHYQQQEQDNQNSMTSSSSSSNNSQTDVNKQSLKKIKSLLKQISKSRRHGSIEELERAILHRDSRTRCITIPQTSNSTNEQLSRGNLVVEYCRLWRWPNLSNQNELKPVDYCPNAFHYSVDLVCVNPYHYDRVPTIYSVYVPRLPPGTVHTISDLRSSTMQDTMINQIPENQTYEAPFQQPIPSLSSPSLSPESTASQDSFHSPNGESTEPITSMDVDVAPVAAQPNSTISEQASYEQVSFQEPSEWCHLSYYEMSKRVGEQYRATQSQVIIDGFTHPSNAERFCLGGLSNIERTMEIDRARRFIGRGVKLFHIRENVFAECLSDNPVFVQSPIANRRLNWHPATVCKIPPNGRLQIFDSVEFIRLLREATQEGYESVYNLKTMCILRMSLVKGWGVDYRRPSVTCTPCWIEIHLDAPLKWLDEVLSTMCGPNQSINSVS